MSAGGVGVGTRAGRPALTGSFGRLWAAAIAENLGDGIRLVALPLLATRLTTSTALIALVTAVTYLPALVFGPLAGVLTDRVDRRRAMLLANAGRALALLALVALLASHALTLPGLLLFALLYGAGQVVADPASHAYLPRIVPTGQLAAANSRLFTGQIVAEQFVGRAVGGVEFAVAAFLPFAVNAAVLTAAAVLVATLPADRPQPPAEAAQAGIRGVLADLREGLAVVFSSRLLRGMSMLLGMWGATAGAFWGVAVVYATSGLHGGPRAFGIFLAVSAVGSVIGASLATRLLTRWGAFPTVVVSLTVSAAALAGLSLAPNLVVATGLLAANGIATTCWNVLSVTVRQKTVPNRLLGRVSSTYRLLAVLSMPVGAGLAGLLADAAGTRAVFIACGALLAVTGVVLLPGLRAPTSTAWPRERSTVTSAEEVR